MLFSYQSAVREAQRLNTGRTANFATLKKKWYGWIVVDEPAPNKIINLVDHQLLADYQGTPTPLPKELQNRLREVIKKSIQENYSIDEFRKAFDETIANFKATDANA